MYKTYHKKERKSKNRNLNPEIDTNLTNSSKLAENLDKNIADFKQFVGNSIDVNIRNLKLPVNNGIDAAIMFVDGLVDKAAINNSIIYPLLTRLSEQNASPDLIGIIGERIIRIIE